MIGIIINYFKELFGSKIESGVVVAPPAIPAPIKKGLVIQAGELFPNHIVLYKNCEIRPEHKTKCMEVTISALRDKARYEEVSKQSGVPWFVIAGIHRMESDQNFKAVLHNGEKIIGTNKKTTLVPKNRGPFATWEEAAIDALKIEWKPESWTLGETLEFCERYNGKGYRKYGVNTPYVYGFTTVYKRGHFVADNKFDPNAIHKRPGIASMMKCLEELGELQVILGKDAA